MSRQMIAGSIADSGGQRTGTVDPHSGHAETHSFARRGGVADGETANECTDGLSRLVHPS